MLRDEIASTEATWCGTDDKAASGSNEKERCEQVHRTLKRIVKARGSLDAQEAAALREAQALGLWRHYGYSSLLEYMELEMGYTPRAALERLRVAKAIEELPVIAEKLTQGDLSFSAARELTRVVTPDTEEEWLEATSELNLRDVEELVSGRKPGDKPTDPPDPKLRKRVLRFEVRPETVALMRQVQALLEKERGERLDDDAVISTLCRQVLDHPHNERTRAPYQIAVTTCRECKRGWQDGGGLRVEMSPPMLERALCDAEHIGAVDDFAPDPDPLGPRPDTEETATPTNAKQSKKRRSRQEISPALRRKVLRRDGYRCRVTGCRSYRNIDVHHIRPLAQGGKNHEENAISTCEGHHLATHEGTLIIEGTASNPTFTRRANHSFAIAERAVETASALRNLGFSGPEVKTAVDAARTHVGTTPMTLNQWIKIALSYCPRPIT